VKDKANTMQEAVICENLHEP